MTSLYQSTMEDSIKRIQVILSSNCHHVIAFSSSVYHQMIISMEETIKRIQVIVSLSCIKISSWNHHIISTSPSYISMELRNNQEDPGQSHHYIVIISMSYHHRIIISSSSSHHYIIMKLSCHHINEGNHQSHDYCHQHLVDYHLQWCELFWDNFDSNPGKPRRTWSGAH